MRPVCQIPSEEQNFIDGHAMCSFWDFCEGRFMGDEKKYGCYDPEGEVATRLRERYAQRGINYDMLVYGKDR